MMNFLLFTVIEYDPPNILLLSAEYTDSIKATCACKGFPKPTVNWFVNNVNIEGKQGVTIRDVVEANPDFTYSYLTITTISEDYSGDYNCTCKNEYGQTDEVTQLILPGTNYRYILPRCISNYV